jgi:hypothetical protein
MKQEKSIGSIFAIPTIDVESGGLGIGRSATK